MKNYQTINNIFGWLCFAVASFTYLSTIEPTGSFWDCGEFIAAAYKLQVGHPPGAPLFLLVGKIVSLFAGTDVERVALMINALSALSSAFAILFLFWTITALAKKITAPAQENPSPGETIAIMGSGVIGALAYTFSDTFWFSAVEGEVYGTSSFFTAIVVWLMFKWDRVADERHSVRWIILIAYLMGLSIGVHLLNLLAIPALAYIYYFRKYKPTRNGLILTGLVGCFILAFVQYGIIPGVIWVASRFELMCVNGFGLPFNSGIIFYGILIIGGIVYGLNYTRKKNLALWNTAILCVAFIIIGYSSYVQIVVRSTANPPMDENNPDNVFALLSYLNREQYGDRPLVTGQYYDDKMIRQDEGEMNYIKGKDKYLPTTPKITAVYEASHLFPRIYSNQSNHIASYKEWGGIKGEEKPTFAHNIKFFFRYQIGWMYLRYFFWNFAGRQNDIQGHGNFTEGNWISGIPFVDGIRLGPQDTLPRSMTWNKGMNKLYFLPFLLGILGAFFHFKKEKRGAIIVLLLFFFTGIAISIYLNMTPYQPRERDYAFAGSFYAYAIWIGIGVLAIADFLRKKLSPTASAAIATLVCTVVPGIMAAEEWDDHNRARRYTSRDFAYDYLNSCAPNAILFTNGDNDTFPLWYAQEVEGIRTDVRVVNLSLLNTDWYIDQMKRKAYESEALPISMSSDKYVQGTRDYVPFFGDNPKINSLLKDSTMNLVDLIEFISSDEPVAKVTTQGGEKLNYYPVKRFRLDVDSAAVVSNGVVAKEAAGKIVPAIEWNIDRNMLMKADVAILDILAHNQWKRPVYFAVTVGSGSYMNLEEYFQLEGLAYRLVPIKGMKGNEAMAGRVHTAKMYDNMVNKFKWGNMNDPRVYLDENNLRFSMNLRNNFARLAEELINEGKKDLAIKTLDKCIEVMPDKTVPYNVFMLRIAEMYYRAGVNDKANAIISRMAEIHENDLTYYLSLRGEYLKPLERDMQQGMAVMQELIRMAGSARQEVLVKTINERFSRLQEKATAAGYR